MDDNLLYIIHHDVKCRSLKCEILAGKKRLPFKYILPYRNKAKIVQAYKDYLFDREMKKYIKEHQMTLEDFLNE